MLGSPCRHCQGIDGPEGQKTVHREIAGCCETTSSPSEAILVEASSSAPSLGLVARLPPVGQDGAAVPQVRSKLMETLGGGLLFAISSLTPQCQRFVLNPCKGDVCCLLSAISRARTF